MATKPKEENSEESKILREAKQRFSIAQEAWSSFFKEYKDIMKFLNGDQWDHQLRQNRESAGIPVLSVNVLPTYLRQITNESRQNCPAIQVDPKDTDADQETAEVYSDLIRGIEQDSNAATAYDNASWYAAGTGLGFFRVISEYESPTSFFQKLVIKGIDDPETVLMDPNHKCVDGSDSEYCFVVTTYTKEEYKRQFSTSKLATDIDVKGFSTNQSQWIREDEVVVAEYYYKDHKPGKLYKVFNTKTLETIVASEKPSEDLVKSGVLVVVDTRVIDEITIKWAKINDVEILEETSWPGEFIPVIAVKGDESWVDGKRHLKGAVKDAIDSQRAFNYFFSLQAELLSLAPKAPFIGEVRQFANYEHIWRDANTAPSAYLPYNAVESANGQTLPPPMRQTAEVPIQAAMAMCGQARDNIKGVFGVFDASMGAQGNEVSGKAILARTEQSHTTTYHFYDNLAKAVQQAGRILVQSIPTFYADERSVQLIKRNGQSSTSRINDGSPERDINKGNYGVVVETGPSYATRRQDSVAHMITLGEAYPQAMPLIADLIASESDWPGSKAIAARLRMALPPEIQQQEAASGKGITPEAQAQMAISQVKQLTGQLQQLQGQDQKAQELLKNADEEIKLLKLKSGVELAKADKDFEIKEKQMMLDELEAELSYKVKLRELDLQKEQLDIERAKVGIKTVETMSDLNDNMHDRTMAHIDKVTKVIDVPAPTKPHTDSVSENVSPSGNLEGIDKSFQTMSGEDVTNG